VPLQLWTWGFGIAVYGGSPLNQLQPLILAQHLHAELGGLGGLGAGVFADDDVIGLLGDGGGDLGAEGFGAGLGLVAGHLGQRAGEDDGLAGNRAAFGADHLGVLDLDLLREVVEGLEVVLLGEEIEDVAGDRFADLVDVVEILVGGALA